MSLRKFLDFIKESIDDLKSFKGFEVKYNKNLNQDLTDRIVERSSWGTDPDDFKN